MALAFSVSAQTTSSPDTNSSLSMTQAVKQMESADSRFNTKAVRVSAGSSINGNSVNSVNITINPQGSSFLKIEDDATIQKQLELNKYLKGAVTEIGAGSPVSLSNTGGSKPLSGFARELPLVEVLKQILPEEWSATASKSVDINKKV